MSVDVASPADRPVARRPSGYARPELRRDATVVACTLTWVPLVLVLDRGADLWCQRALGVGTWLLLAGCSAARPRSCAPRSRWSSPSPPRSSTRSPRCSRSTSTGSTTCRPSSRPATGSSTSVRSPSAGLRSWRADATPLVVVTVARRRGLRRRGACWSPTGSTCWARSGSAACWASCAGAGQSTLYVGAFAVVTYLELLGTWLGTWAWQSHDPTGLVAIGNPPSGAAGGYGWFDLAAVLAAPALLLAVRRLLPADGRRRVHWRSQLRDPRQHDAKVVPSRCQRDHLVVQRAVGRHGAATGRAAVSRQSVNRPPASSTMMASAARSYSVTSGSHGDVDGALGDEHVGPEVAVGPAAPHRPRQLEERFAAARCPPSRRSWRRTARRRSGR